MSRPKHKGTGFLLNQKRCVRHGCSGTMIPVLVNKETSILVKPNLHNKKQKSKTVSKILPEWECYKCHKSIPRFDPITIKYNKLSHERSK